MVEFEAGGDTQKDLLEQLFFALKTLMVSFVDLVVLHADYAVLHLFSFWYFHGEMEIRGEGLRKTKSYRSGLGFNCSGFTVLPPDDFFSVSFKVEVFFSN